MPYSSALLLLLILGNIGPSLTLSLGNHAPWGNWNYSPNGPRGEVMGGNCYGTVPEENHRGNKNMS